MDPNFVQHSIPDLVTRFSGYLIFILAYSTAIHGGVNGAFALLGIDVQKSKWDDIVKGALGMALALMLDFNLFFYVAGMTNAQYMNALPRMAEHGSPAAGVPAGLGFATCNVITGTMVVGGKRVIVGVAREFTSGVEAIKKAFSKKTD